MGCRSWLSYGALLGPALLSACAADVFDYAVDLPAGNSLTHGSCANFALDDGAAQMWGRNPEGNWGAEPSDFDSVAGFYNSQPTPIDLEVEIAQIASYKTHTCVLGIHGRVWCGGDNSEGQLGQGHRP